MGLDQYLRAKRQFEPDSEEAEAVLAAAGVSLAELQHMATQDPYEVETEVYLSMWGFSSDDRPRAEATLNAAGLLPLKTEDSPSGYLRWEDEKVTVGITCLYWRKANSVHSWFVEHCQGGVDECQVSPVDVEQLAHLRATCVDALQAYLAGDSEKAEELMTPRSGFFFGSCDIDEWWAEGLQHTASEIERVVQTAVKIGGVSFEYQSSW